MLIAKIAVALINKLFKRLYSFNDYIEFAVKIKKRIYIKKLLEDFVTENKIHLKTKEWNQVPERMESRFSNIF